MIFAPTLSAIYAAELKVAHSRLQTHAALHRQRIAFSAALVRPVSFVAVALATATFCYCLTRRSRSKTGPASEHASDERIAPVVAFTLDSLLRHVRQQLTAILLQAWAAKKNAQECDPATKC
jgi:hypothetical protein